MKTLKILTVVMLILQVMFLLVQPAEVLGRYYGRYGFGWWGYPYGWGYPYWWGYPYYPYPYPYPYYDPYYYGGYGQPPVPPQGVTPPSQSGQQQPSYWYFCQNPEGYYPYVKNCPGGWMAVVPSKPNAAPPSTLAAPVTK